MRWDRSISWHGIEYRRAAAFGYFFFWGAGAWSRAGLAAGSAPILVILVWAMVNRLDTV